MESFREIVEQVANSKSKDTKKQNEKKLENLLKVAPSQCFEELTRLLKNKENGDSSEVRIFAAQTMRQILLGNYDLNKGEEAISQNESNPTTNEKTSTWKLLSTETQEDFISIINKISSEENRKLRLQLGLCFGELVFNEELKEENAEGEYSKKLFNLLESEGQQEVQCGLKAVQSCAFHTDLIIDCLDEKLASTFQRLLEKFENDNEMTGLLLLSFWEVIPFYLDDVHQHLGALFQPFLHLLIKFFQQNQNEESNSEIEKLLQRNGEHFEEEFVAKNYIKWLEIIEKAVLDPETSLHYLQQETLVKFIVNIVANSQIESLLKDETPDQLKGGNVYKLFNLIFQIMKEEDVPPSEEWLKTREGQIPDFIDQKELHRSSNGTLMTDSLLGALLLPEKQMKYLFYPIIDAHLKDEDWPSKFASILMFSMSIEYSKEWEADGIHEDVKNRISQILALLDVPNQSPMIEYAIFHLIGTASSDLNPNFYEWKGQELIDTCLKYGKSKVYRVAEHALSAFVNLVQLDDEEHQLQIEKISSILNDLIEIVKDQEIPSCVKEGAVTSIANLSYSIKDLINPHIEMIMENIIELANKRSGDLYKQLRNQIIECGSMISSMSSKEVFAPFFPAIVQMILDVGVLERGDKQRPYLISAWNRLLQNFSEEIVQQKEEIFETIRVMSTDMLEYANEVYKNYQIQQSKTIDEKNKKELNNKNDGQDVGEDNEEEEEEEEGKEGKIFQDEEYLAFEDGAQALQLIKKMCEFWPNEMSPFIEKIIDYIIPFIGITSENSDMMEMNIKSESVESFAPAILSLWRTSPAQAKDYSQKLLLLITKEKCFDESVNLPELEMMITSLSDIISKAPQMFFSGFQIFCTLQTNFEQFYSISTLLTKIENYKKEITSQKDQKSKKNKPTANSRSARGAVQPEDDEDEDNDEDAILQDIEEQLEDMTHLAESIQILIGELIKTHSTMIQPNTINSLNNIIKGVLMTNGNVLIQKQFLFVLTDIVTYIDFLKFQSHWKIYYNIFTGFATHAKPEMRQCAVFGLGVLLQQLDNETSAKEIVMIEKALSTLSSAINNYSIFNDSQNNHAKDNAKSAIGQIFYKHFSLLKPESFKSMMKDYLKMLPLTFDREEGHLALKGLQGFLMENIGFLSGNEEFIELIVNIAIKFFQSEKNLAYQQVTNSISTNEIVVSIFALLDENFHFQDSSNVEKYLPNIKDQNDVQFLNKLISKDPQLLIIKKKK